MKSIHNVFTLAKKNRWSKGIAFDNVDSSSIDFKCLRQQSSARSIENPLDPGIFTIASRHMKRAGLTLHKTKNCYVVPVMLSNVTAFL